MKLRNCAFVFLSASAALLGQGPGPLSITSISPTFANQFATQTITINGTGFDTCTRPRFNGVVQQNFTPISGTQMQVPMITQTAGTVQVDVNRFPFVIGTSGFICQTSGGVESNDLPFTVVPQLRFVSTEVVSGTRNTAYSFQLQAAGGRGSYTFTTQTPLPAGITLSAGGLLSGTPTVAGSFNFTVNLRDCGGFEFGCTTQFATRQFVLTIIDTAPNPLRITTTGLSPGTNCALYNGTIAATGGTPPYTYSATGLPPGLTLNASTGAITGRPLQDGSFSPSFTVRDSAVNPQGVATATLPITIGAGAFQVTTTALANGQVGQSYSQTLLATGGTSPLVWALASGSLPQGILLGPSTGQLAGTPTQAGSFNPGFRVTDANSCTASRSLPVTIAPSTSELLQITTTSLPSAQVGQFYQVTIQATGGSSPYTWSSVTQLPSGLSLNVSTGVLSGTPLVGGDFPINVQVRDANQTASRQLILNIVTSQLQITTTTLPSASVGQFYQVTIQASGGVTPYTWSSVTQLPSGLSLNQSTGVLSGTPLIGGDFSLNIQVRDNTNQTVSRQLLLNVATSQLQITTTTLPGASIGQQYEFALQAIGGTGALSWSNLSALPPGISLSPTTGLLFGTPTQTGDFTINVQVRDSANQIANRSLLLRVSTGLQIVTDAIPTGLVNTRYEVAFSASGGVPPYRWNTVSVLPVGVSLDMAGVLSGTPTQTGTFRVNVILTDSINSVTSREFVLTVSSGFTITTPALPNGVVNTNYNVTLSSTGGTGTVTWGLDSGTLPPGVTLNPTTGGITGQPSQAGTFTFTVFALDSAARRLTRQFTVTITGPPGTFRIVTESLPNGAVGESYSVGLKASDGVDPITWAVVTGSLPGGVTLAAATGELSGTPTTAGSFTFTVEARDRNNQTARQSFTIVIIGPLTITTQSLPDGVINVAYSASLAAEGGQTPYQWSVSAGNLPDGVTLNASTGALSGTPTRAANFSFTMQVRDAGNRTATRAYQVTIGAGLMITTQTIPGGTVGVAYSAQLAATGGSGTLVWTVSAGALPAGVTLSGAGLLSGTPTTAGSFTFTASVRDAQGLTANRAFTTAIASLAITGVTITPNAAQPGQQPAVQASLGANAPTALTGTLTLTFASEAGADNPQVSFSSLNGRTATFQIPAGQRDAVFAGGGALMLQTGTVAGTITITMRLNAGGVDVTPSPAPAQIIRVERAVPVLESMTARRAGNTLTVEITGFATSREVVTAEFQFQVAAGANVTTTSFTVPVGTAFTGWYQNSASIPLGSAFLLTMTFNVSGDANVVTGVQATLINAVGRSQPRSANF